MNIWWLVDPAYMLNENAAVDALASEGWFFVERRFAKLHLLTVEGTLHANGHQYAVRLVYPDQYPSVPPWVEPQDQTAKWSTHQYGVGGSFCLETRPETWEPGMTACDVLRSARKLLEKENPKGEVKGEVPVDHRVGAIQAYDFGPNVILINAACEAHAKQASAVLRAQRWFVSGDLVPILLFDDEDLARGIAPRVPTSALVSPRAELPVLMSSVAPPAESPTDPAQLSRISGVDATSPTEPVIIVMTGGETIAAYAVLKGTVYEQRVAVLAGQPGTRGGRPAVAKKKRVGVVGVGSIGSKIAEMLVRSGVERLLLVDGDVFLPENLDRHVLDWRDVGARKVDALKARLAEIAPTSSIETIADNLNWQRSARTHAWQAESLCECDVIVDATGDVPSALFSGALAFMSERAFVSAEVFEGGIGALVGHFVPKLSPPYINGRGAYRAYCDERAVAPPERGPRRYEALSDNGDVFIADDAAVTIAASHAARVVLDILDGTEVRREWMLLGFKKAWLFNHHGHNIMLDVGEPPPPRKIEQSLEGLTLANKLAKESIDAARAASTPG